MCAVHTWIILLVVVHKIGLVVFTLCFYKTILCLVTFFVAYERCCSWYLIEDKQNGLHPEVTVLDASLLMHRSNRKACENARPKPVSLDSFKSKSSCFVRTSWASQASYGNVLLQLHNVSRWFWYRVKLVLYRTALYCVRLPLVTVCF